LVVEVLQSDDLVDLIQAEIMPDAAVARGCGQPAGAVAVIIPVDFSHQFADPYGKAEIEFYQDPTLTISPGVVKSILSQFMDGMAGIKIAADIAQEQAEMLDDPRQAGVMVGGVIQEYLRTSMVEEEDLSEAMLMVSAPQQKPQEESNPVLSIVGPIMAGMMIFYAFYTGVATAESILREEEERTMQRLFHTNSTTVILSVVCRFF
jgi:ABC-type Na+ efflux pump permease subunit